MKKMFTKVCDVRCFHGYYDVSLCDISLFFRRAKDGGLYGYKTINILSCEEHGNNFYFLYTGNLMESIFGGGNQAVTEGEDVVMETEEMD